MPLRIDRFLHDPLGGALTLLDLHQRWLRPAILTLAARKEQDLRRLSHEELDTVLGLLDLDADTDGRAIAVQALGPEKAYALLQEVIRQPKVPAPGYPYIVHAYQEQHIDGVTWLLEEVTVAPCLSPDEPAPTRTNFASFSGPGLSGKPFVLTHEWSAQELCRHTRQLGGHALFAWLRTFSTQ